MISGKTKKDITSNNYVYYDDEVTEKLRFIKMAKAVGFTLAEINIRLIGTIIVLNKINYCSFHTIYLIGLKKYRNSLQYRKSRANGTFVVLISND